MLTGTVTGEGIPQIELSIGGQTWIAVVDTGFNGDLELPLDLQSLLGGHRIGRVVSQLAGGYEIEEELYLLRFHFDGEDRLVEAVFAPGSEILIGTRLLDRHRLEIDFPAQTLQLTRDAA